MGKSKHMLAFIESPRRRSDNTQRYRRKSQCNGIINRVAEVNPPLKNPGKQIKPLAGQFSRLGFLCSQKKIVRPNAYEGFFRWGRTRTLRDSNLKIGRQRYGISVLQSSG